MSSVRILMPTMSSKSESLANQRNNGKDICKESSILRRPGVPVTTIQNDWICKRVSHFTVNTDADLIGFGLYNQSGGRENINIEITIREFKTGKIVFETMATLPPAKLACIQRLLFNHSAALKPGRLYEATAYYHQMVPLYLKSDPFQSVQSISTHYGPLTCEFRQMLPKGRYRAECYPSEIPELIFA